MHDTSRAAIVVVGFSDDARALIDHLELEAPALLPRLIVVDPSPEVVDRLRDAGLRAVRADTGDPAGLAALGLGEPALVVHSGRAAAPPPVRSRHVSMLGNWRLWVLLGVTIVDGLVFMIPLTPTVLLLAALVAPGWVRWTAGFLDGLAGGPGEAPRGSSASPR